MDVSMSEQVKTAKKTGQESTGAYRAQLARILANILKNHRPEFQEQSSSQAQARTGN